jgi:hypothetical protein
MFTDTKVKLDFYIKQRIGLPTRKTVHVDGSVSYFYYVDNDDDRYVELRTLRNSDSVLLITCDGLLGRGKAEIFRDYLFGILQIKEQMAGLSKAKSEWTNGRASEH